MEVKEGKWIKGGRRGEVKRENEGKRGSKSGGSSGSEERGSKEKLAKGK